MLNEKDHKEIAKMIALCRCNDPICDVESGINRGCQDMAHRLMEYFELNDPQFDRKQFDDICFAD